MMNTLNQQKGLAIITVLLIVALMVTLLGFLLEQQHLLMRRIANQNIVEQGFQYATGVDEWAARVLHDDPIREIDFSDEDWAKFGDPAELGQQQEGGFTLDNSSQQEEEPLPVIDFGIENISYKIEDLQARYNLNNLANEDKVQLESQKTVFLNLLRLLEIGDTDTRNTMYASLVDWMDKNNLNSANGAESPEYQSGNTPYFAADQKLSTLGELKYVQGFSSEVINLLEPYVIVLPVNNARININSASTEVLTALNGSRAELDTTSVESFLAQRLEEGFQGFQPNQIQAAQTAIIGAEPLQATVVKNMLQTNSQFFRVSTRVELGDFRYCSYSTLFRQNADSGLQSTPKVSVLSRYYNTICDEIIR